MAEGTGTYAAEQVERLLQCAICLDKFTNPKILPCQHTFCKTPCLEQLIDMRSRLIRCPECRAEHAVPYNGVNGYPTNITMSGFLDLPAASARASSAIEPEGGTVNKCGVCETEAPTSRCFHCNKYACESCRESHSGQMRVEVGRLINQLRRCVPKLSNTISSVEQKSEQVKQHVETIKSEITDTVERYNKEMKEREKMLRSELETFLQGEQRSLRLHQENIEVELASVSSYCDSTEGLLSQTQSAGTKIPDADLVNMRKQCSEYMEHIREAESNPIPITREVRFKFEGQELHGAITGFGGLEMTSPGASVSRGTTSSNNNSGSRSRLQSETSQRRARWNEIEPLDPALLEALQVSGVSPASTPRGPSLRQSASPLSQPSPTPYTRISHSSVDPRPGNSNYTGARPAARPPAQARTTSNYMFAMGSPSGRDMMDMMDQMRQEELLRRGGRGGAGNPRVERAPGLVGVGGAATAGRAQWGGRGVGSRLGRDTGARNLADLMGIEPDRDADLPGPGAHGSRRAHVLSRTASEPRPPDPRPEPQVINTATPRPVVQRQAETFDVPMSDGPQRGQASGPPPLRSNRNRGSRNNRNSNAAAAEASSNNTAPNNTAASSNTAVSNNTASNNNTTASNNTANNNATTSSGGASGSSSTNSNSQQSANNNSAPDNASQASTSSAATASQPPSLARSRTFVQAEGPSNTDRSVPTVTNQAVSFEVSLTEAEVAELAAAAGEDASAPGDSLTTTRPINNYHSKGRMILKIGGERGNGQGKFTWPRGVAISPVNDSIIVADSSNHRVQLFDCHGHYVSMFGSYGSGEGEFDCLAGSAVSESGHIIIADRYNHRVQVFDRYGEFSTAFGVEGSGDGQLNYPWGVAIDSRSQIYVCDKENHRIQVFGIDGTFLRKFGSIGNSPGQMENPHYVACGSGGKVVVSDCNNHRLQVFTGDGRFQRCIGSEGSDPGQLKFPKGVAMDRQGFIVVADSGNNRVQVFREDGRHFCSFGTYGSGSGQFKGMEGLALTSRGTIVVTDKENHRIQMF